MGLVVSAHLPAPSSPAAQEQDAIALFEQGVELFNARKFREARDVFRRVFELDPNPFVIFNIGRCYEELGELEEAVRYYDRSLKLEGLPEAAKIEAVSRIEQLAPRIEAIKTRRKAVAEAALRVDRSFYVAQTDARNKAEMITSPPPPVEPPGRTALTWIGVGTSSVGLIALGAGLLVDLNIGDKLDEQDALIASYQTLGQEAIAQRDPDKAAAAIAQANEVNALADEIEDDQLAASLLFGAGGLLVVGGLVMILIDTPDDAAPAEPNTSLQLIPAPGGVGVVATW